VSAEARFAPHGALLAVLLTGCGGEDSGPAEPAAAEPSPWHDEGPFLFRDASAESGLALFRQENGSPEKPFLVETVGAGVALFDHDQDGDLDAWLTNGGSLGRALAENPSDALFVNDGAGRFQDGSAAAGVDERRWTNGVRTLDVDGDGAQDVYLTNYGPNSFFVADGAGRYRERAEACGIADPSWSTGATFFDFERDGDLDLFVSNYVAFDEEYMLRERPTIDYQGVEVMKGPSGLPGAGDRFFVHEDGLRFVERTAELGFGDELFGFQSVAFDFDADGWLDLFVANDSVANNLWRNQQGQRFVDVALRQGLAFSISGRPQAGMGVGAGDFDLDLDLDLYVTNFTDDYSTLYRADADGFFTDVTQSIGLARPTMDKLAWATGFDDFDLDGDLELHAVNGHVYPQVDRFRLGTEYRQPVQLFCVENGHFREPEGRGGVALAAKGAGRGSATGDVDGDGDVDLLIGNLDAPPRLLLNETKGGRGLALELVGPGANRAAVGARAYLRCGERELVRHAALSTGFLSSSSPTLVFGLGTLPSAGPLRVVWPDGREERFEGPFAAGARVRVRAGAAGAAATLEVR